MTAVNRSMRQNIIKYGKIDGKFNPADLFTKGLGEEDIIRHVERLGGKFHYDFDGGALTTRPLESSRSWRGAPT